MLRAQGFRVIIFTDDHEPAHVHVFGDGHAKINLFGFDKAPHLVWASQMSKADIRKAMALVTEHQHILIAKWREIHG